MGKKHSLHKVLLHINVEEVQHVRSSVTWVEAQRVAQRAKLVAGVSVIGEDNTPAVCNTGSTSIQRGGIKSKSSNITHFISDKEY